MTYADRSAQTIALTLLLTLITVGFAASLVLATDVYLLIFLAILTAVMFANVARWLSNFNPLPYGANLGITIGSFLLLVMVTFAFFGFRIEQQIKRTSDEVDESFAKLEDWLDDHPTVRTAVRRIPFVDGLLQQNMDLQAGDGEDGKPEAGEADQAEQGDSSRETEERTLSRNQTRLGGTGSQPRSAGWGGVGLMSSVSGRVFGVVGKLFSTTFGSAMNVSFVLFVGIFLAIRPQFYRDHFALLFPPGRRSRVTEILDDVGETLFAWLQGRAATMAITGVGTAIVLWLLGVPLALTLGVITGLLTFIPNIGAILALTLSMLVALSQGPGVVLGVVIAYGVLQFIESNIVTPVIQQHQTSVPPPILLSAQLMMAVTTGFLGVLVATPLVAAVIVLVREVYVKDVLGDNAENDSENPGSGHAKHSG